MHKHENRAGGNNGISGSHTIMKAARKIAALIVVFLLVASCSVSKQEPLLTKLEESGYAHLTSSSAIELFLTELSNRNPTAEETKLPFCGDIFKDFVRSDPRIQNHKRPRA